MSWLRAIIINPDIYVPFMFAPEPSDDIIVAYIISANVNYISHEKPNL